MSRKEDIGERIKTMRLARGMSQGDLAAALHCGQSTVAMWEGGQRQPDLDMIDYLADVFNVPPYAILFSEEEIARRIETFSPEEVRLVYAFRMAEPIIARAALEMLENHPAKMEDQRHA